MPALPGTCDTGDTVRARSLPLFGSRVGRVAEDPDPLSWSHSRLPHTRGLLARSSTRGTPSSTVIGVPTSRLPPGGRGPKEPALLRSASGEAEARDLTQLHCTGKSATLNRPPKRGNLKQFMETAGAAEVVACLDSGADLEARDLLGWTPLHMASRAQPGSSRSSPCGRRGRDGAR